MHLKISLSNVCYSLSLFDNSDHSKVLFSGGSNQNHSWKASSWNFIVCHLYYKNLTPGNGQIKLPRSWARSRLCHLWQRTPSSILTWPLPQEWTINQDPCKPSFSALSIAWSQFTGSPRHMTSIGTRISFAKAVVKQARSWFYDYGF